MKYLTTTLTPATIAIVHDNSEYGKGLAVDQLAAQLAETDIEIVTTEAIDPESEDFSAAVNAVQAANPEVIFFGGYYEEAGRLKKQLTDAGVEAQFISGDGSLDVGFIEAAGDAAEGAILSCPCYFASEAAEDPAISEFATAYEEINGTVPGTYSTEAFDAANILLNGILAGNTDRESLFAYVEGLTDVPEAISKEVVFEENGNIEAQGIFLFEVKDGAIALLAATDDLLGRRQPSHAVTRGRPRGRPLVLSAKGTTHRHRPRSPRRPVLAADRRRADAGLDLRPHRARLHARLRRPAPDQLRPLRDLHDRHLRQPVRHARAWASTCDPPDRLVARRDAADPDRRGDDRVGARRGPMERIAYRPLRRRNAPRLAALITAIGISLFLQELFALRYGRDRIGFPRVLEKRRAVLVRGRAASAPTRCSWSWPRWS